MYLLVKDAINRAKTELPYLENLTNYIHVMPPKDIVYNIMETWRQKVSVQHPFKEEEMENIIKGCYDGHGGQGYTYGWDDPIIKFYCDSTCKLASRQLIILPSYQIRPSRS